MARPKKKQEVHASVLEYHEKIKKGEIPGMETKKDSDKNDKDKDAPKTKKSGETRPFQTGPGTHEDLTREEAEEKGFFWGDLDSAQVGRSIAPSSKAPAGHEKAPK